MTLYEIYYHDAWRTSATYGRQYITTSAEDAAQWLLENVEDWYDEDDDPKIDYVVDQGLEQAFNYMTIKTIVINDDGTVEWG